jgi:hypothetical protein
MAVLSHTMSDPDALFSRVLLRCPRCDAARLRAIADGEDVNFFCEGCGACWHVELGWVHRVDPTTCPGCPARGECTSRYAFDHLSVTRLGE